MLKRVLVLFISLILLATIVKASLLGGLITLPFSDVGIGSAKVVSSSLVTVAGQLRAAMKEMPTQWLPVVDRFLQSVDKLKEMKLEIQLSTEVTNTISDALGELKLLSQVVNSSSNTISSSLVELAKQVTTSSTQISESWNNSNTILKEGLILFSQTMNSGMGVTVMIVTVTSLVIFLSKYHLNPVIFILPPLLIAVLVQLIPDVRDHLQPVFLSAIVMLIVGVTCAIYSAIFQKGNSSALFFFVIIILMFMLNNNLLLKIQTLEKKHQVEKGEILTASLKSVNDLHDKLSSELIALKNSISFNEKTITSNRAALMSMNFPFTQIGNVDVEGGSLNDSADRHKENEKAVTFSTPFLRPPEVHVSFCGMDTDRSENLRFFVRVKSVSATHFVFYYYAWGKSRVYNAQFCWTASGFTNGNTLNAIQ